MSFNNITEFIKRFTLIKNKTFYFTTFDNNEVGKTFESEMGIVENNNPSPDFGTIEIKSIRDYASLISLFTKTPTFPKNASRLIREFGVENKYGIKRIHISVYSHRTIEFNGNWFQLKADKSNLYLWNSNQITIYWDLDNLKKTFERKCNLIAFLDVYTNSKTFIFKNCVLAGAPSFERFMELIKEGKILCDIRMGGTKKSHDHGIGFRISKSNFKNEFKLFEI